MTDSSQRQSFRNMNELTAYLSGLENRLAELETENGALRNTLDQVRKQAASVAFKTERGLPETGLVSDSFFVRAFTVWGHYFVAQLIIAIPLTICYLIFFFTVMAGMEF